MVRLHLGKLAFTAGLAVTFWAFSGTASAQLVVPGVGCSSCSAQGCGGAPQGPVGKGPCSSCGLRIYPVFEKRYIRQFCGPTINPGSCFGHYKTQWTPWGGACPNWGGEGYMASAASAQPTLDQIPANKSDTIPPIGPLQKEPLPAPKPLPSNDPAVPPLKDPLKVPPSVPPTVPPVNPPKLGADSGLPIPSVPAPTVK